jgi:hypothetical protein
MVQDALEDLALAPLAAIAQDARLAQHPCKY